MRFLRDFVHEHYLVTPLLEDDDRWVLQKENEGVPLTIDHYGSWTLSFELALIDSSDENVCLMVFETLSIFVLTAKLTENSRIVLVFSSSSQRIEICINQQSRTVATVVVVSWRHHLLPKVASSICVLALQ